MAYKTKKDIVYSVLKQEILEGKLTFGDKLVISKLSKRFEVSDIPVREAIRHLEAEKLVDIKTHVGAVVASFSPKEIQDIFDLRIELEGLATRLATDHLTDEQIREIESIMDKSEACIAAEDFKGFFKYNYEFHIKIYENSNNLLLLETIQNLWENTKRYPSLFEDNKDQSEISASEHRGIMEAISSKDKYLAEKLMKQHKAEASEKIQILIMQKLNLKE